MIRLYDYFKSKPDIAKNGFKEARITFIKKRLIHLYNYLMHVMIILYIMFAKNV